MSVEILESLLDHPGWRLYQEHVGIEWGPKAYAQKLKTAVAGARTHGKDASQAIELVDAGNDAIAEAMRWPAEELARLKRAEQTPELSMARGGYHR